MRLDDHDRYFLLYVTVAVLIGVVFFWILWDARCEWLAKK